MNYVKCVRKHQICQKNIYQGMYYRIQMIKLPRGSVVVNIFSLHAY